MPFKFSHKCLALLVLFTIMLLSFYQFGLFNRSLSINYTDEQVKLISMEGMKAELSHQDSSMVHCRLIENVQYNWCGLAINLTDYLDRGINLEVYDYMALHLGFQSSDSTSNLRLSLRNYNERYASTDDLVSLKFNTLSFDPSKHGPDLVLPLNAFQVESWWVEEFNVPFEDSHVDMSNVSRIEFLNSNILWENTYSFNVNNIVFHGKWIHFKELLLLIFLTWVLVAVFLVTKQQLDLDKSSAKDVLTGALNRGGIQKAIERTTSEHDIYLLYIDVNEFKTINDVYGYDVGDELLRYVANLLKSKMNALASPSFLSRLSGDEFLLAFCQTSEEDMQDLAASIVSHFKQPVMLVPCRVRVSVSIGIAHGTLKETGFDGLLADAGAAMLHAKQDKSINIQLFDDELANKVHFKKQLVEHIKEALSQDQFHLNFMPIYDAKTLDIAAFEVLLRCDSEKMQGIGPDTFIPLAEEYHLIREIDLWVLEHAFSTIQQNRAFLEAHPVKFYINISTDELRNQGFKADLEKLLNIYDVPPEWLTLELTETCFIDDHDSVTDMLQDIRSLGIHLSLDDFGTGYISFNQLVNYPVNGLKVDKSFVDLLEKEDSSADIIIQSILSMAGAYSLDTVGEGVETAEQFVYLRELGCRHIQGYLLSKPVPWHAAKSMLERPETEEVKGLKSLLKMG